MRTILHVERVSQEYALPQCFSVCPSHVMRENKVEQCFYLNLLMPLQFVDNFRVPETFPFRILLNNCNCSTNRLIVRMIKLANKATSFLSFSSRKVVKVLYIFHECLMFLFYYSTLPNYVINVFQLNIYNVIRLVPY